MREQYITKLAEQYIHMMTDIGGIQRVFDRRTGEQCGVRVVKPISRTPCVLNATFGCHGSSQMWVNNGCRATFAINQRSLACGYTAGPMRTVCPNDVDLHNQSSELRVPEGAHLLQLDSDPLKCSDIDDAGARRSRLAFEITGCLRTLNLSLRVKLDLLAAARTAVGFERIDLYCALEACDGESDEHSVRIVDALVSGVRAVEPCAAIQCHWWPSAAGILLKNQLASPNRTERLKPEYRADHPHYPYSNHNPETSVDHTLSMCFKLAIVGQLRNRSRMRYDLVWRTRTDFYVVNVSWPLLRTLVARHRPATLPPPSHRAATLPPPSASQTPAPKYLPWFLTPTVDERLQWFHQMTDVEAFLSEPAAARYDSWWWKIPSLYASGVVFHPETMLTALMHADLARFHDPQMKVVRGLPAGRLKKGIHLATPTCRASLYGRLRAPGWRGTQRVLARPQTVPQQGLAVEAPTRHHS
jgi:hypothetical protein